MTKRLDQLKVDFNATAKDRLTVRWRDWYPLTIGYGGTFGAGGNWNFHRQGYTKSENSLQTTYTRTFGVESRERGVRVVPRHARDRARQRGRPPLD